MFQPVLGMTRHTYLHFQTVFLVGGLSTNDWVWSRLQSYFKARNIGICRPDNHMYVLSHLLANFADPLLAARQLPVGQCYLVLIVIIA